MLREVRRKPPSASWVSISGADPLNLVGILTPGPRLPALTGNRLLYRDGLPVAMLAAGEMVCLETLEGASQWEARAALLRSAGSVAHLARSVA
jgi:ATP-dependent Lhr-like helicase